MRKTVFFGGLFNGVGIFMLLSRLKTVGTTRQNVQSISEKPQIPSIGAAGGVLVIVGQKGEKNSALTKKVAYYVENILLFILDKYYLV